MGIVFPPLKVLVSSLKKILKFGFGFSVGYYTLTHEVGDWYLITEDSMEPVLSDGDIVIVKPLGNNSFLTAVLKEFVLAFGYNQIGIGDLIIAKNPTHPKLNICKRVIGIEGHRLPFEYRQLKKFVPAGTVWVEGDNTQISRDSRNFGPLPIGLIQGLVVARVWPTLTFFNKTETNDMRAETCLDQRQ